MVFVVVSEFLDVVLPLVGALQVYLVVIVVPFFLVRHRHVKSLQ